MPTNTCTQCYCAIFSIVVPSAPINVMSQSITSMTATIIWEDGPLTNPVNPPITGYRVFRNDSLVGGTIPSRELTFHSLTPFTTYSVTVIAINSVGDSEMSQAYEFTTMKERKYLHSYRLFSNFTCHCVCHYFVKCCNHSGNVSETTLLVTIC